MGSSAKKKKEKKKDFQKTKLKVGKARPKNTNATDTSFASKSIVFKQQNLTESARDSATLAAHNLSLLGSKNETQRKDALIFFTSLCADHEETMAVSPTVIAGKAMPLVLDGSAQVRTQLLKLLRALSTRGDLGAVVDQLLLYARAGMAHLSSEIRLSSLDVLNWMLEGENALAVVSSAGGWIKTLRTFQNLLSWHGEVLTGNAGGKWSTSKSTSNLGSSKLLVHQLTTLSRFLHVGLVRPSLQEEAEAAAQRAAALFPLWHTDAHLLPTKSNPFGYLNLFGAVRDVESEVYEDAEQRAEIFVELGVYAACVRGAKEARKEAGEVGRAAALVEKALKLVDGG
ncbi:Rix1 complex component [Neohortaea acidophila]|uniref:Pre-rRNA-processing protein n=1 Tax=Neohortaea acidophila TaxID=245834 RepID=A0A6A6PIM6_9PEZI|nr:Rix1 complex component [Neohortaea acidophila]KAF2479383.1 Rix1 complex component [Neohortaea acidophila]